MKKVVLAVCMVVFLAIVSCAGAEGSWSQINQSVEKQTNWTKIVMDPSAFQLGETKPYAEDETLYVGDWGTYPSMDGSTVCVPMAMEFARQWLNISEEDLSGFVNFSTTPNAYNRLTASAGNPQVTIVSKKYDDG